MTTKAIAPQADWFDRLWDGSVAKQLPIYLRNDSIKNLARQAVSTAVESLGAFGKTPEGVRQIVAYARIVAILQGSQNVLHQPDPSPEQVADAVERLVQRVKP